MIDMKHDAHEIETPEELRARGLRPIMGGDGETEPTVEKPAVEAPPAYFVAHAEMVSGAIKTMADNIAVLAGLARPAAPVAAADTIDEEIEEALRTGQGAATINKAIDKRVEKRIAEQVGPQMQAGLEAIQRMTAEVATAAVGADGKPKMPYFKRFNAEINEVLGRLPAGTKINPETYQWAHDLVAGRHIGELTAEAIEQGNRSRATETPGSQGGALRTARTASAASATDVPSVAEYMGEEFAQTLEQMGRTPDQHAKNLGYVDWKDYVTKGREIEKMAGASAEAAAANRGKGSRR